MVRNSRKTLSDAFLWGRNSVANWETPNEAVLERTPCSRAAGAQTRQSVRRRQTNDTFVKENSDGDAFLGKRPKQTASPPEHVAVAPDVVELLDRIVPKKRFRKGGRSLSLLFGQKAAKPCTQMHANALFDVLSTDESLAELANDNDDGNCSSLNGLSVPPFEETFGIRDKSHTVRNSLTRDSALSFVSEESSHFDVSHFSPAFDRGTEKMTLSAIESMDREEDSFDVNEFDVATHAARCAFLRTLRSPFEATSKTVLVDSPKEHVPSNWREHRRVHARRLDAEMRLHRMSGRGRVSDALDNESCKSERRARSKRSQSILPKFRSWFMCFTAQETTEEPTTPKRKPIHRHLPTESSKGFAMLQSRGSAMTADSSAHRYHRRQDFMRSLLESQLDDTGY